MNNINKSKWSAPPATEPGQPENVANVSHLFHDPELLTRSLLQTYSDILPIAVVPTLWYDD